ncbi:PRC-barrel domain-containing protein [Rhodococcus marinonascens]|uniref:PRC-barrel domain-containing protein n=1 Tax=Rhodococcus marinonascens TaxID=38311 RepID=UPI002481C247|nr:PRC-barrel domain-containing protein [Rhodococcus marinonascens]
MIDKRVLTSTGNELGTLTDVDFDPDSGPVTSLILDAEDVGGARLVGVGSYVVDAH